MASAKNAPAEQAPTSEPSMADVLAQLAALQAQVASQAPAVAERYDFADEKAAADKAGALKVVMVEPMQKGAAPALRVDH